MVPQFIAPPERHIGVGVGVSGYRSTALDRSSKFALFMNVAAMVSRIADMTPTNNTLSEDFALL